MTVRADGGAPAGAAPESGPRTNHPPERRRRWVTRRGLFASAAAIVLAPLVAASRAPRTAGSREGRRGPGEQGFDEVYRGRHIKGTPQAAGADGAEGCGWQVTVDGHPLHLMRRADGTWLSMVDHYSSYRTSLEATRGAVDELGPGQRLRDLAPGPLGEQGAHMGGHHGVRA